jgi:uncharacterized lipoprotein YajG
MKKVIIAVSITAALSACSLQPRQQQQVFAPPVTQQNVPITMNTNIPVVSYAYETEVSAMTRTQTIDAVRLCEDAGLRASPVFAKRRITGITSEVVVEVMCLPRYR